MAKLIKKFNELGEKVFRKGFWLFKSHTQAIESEAKKNWGGNESALMRHIISNWFK